MHHSLTAVDGFTLAYSRRGPATKPSSGAVVLLHGRPGDHTDFRHVVPLLHPSTDVVVPDLRGFGRSDKHLRDPDGYYDAPAHARSIAALIGELGLTRPILGGYDIGSRVRLIDAAGELLRLKGPTASGTAEILALAEAPRGSFYFHFPDGKDQLVAEAVERNAAATAEAMKVALEDRSIPIARRIEQFITALADALVLDDYRLGCAVGATALEASATSPRLRQVTEAAFASWTSELTNHLIEEGIEPDRAAMLADTVIASLEGATMMARAGRNAAPLRNVAATLGTLVAAPSTRPRRAT